MKALMYGPTDLRSGWAACRNVGCYSKYDNTIMLDLKRFKISLQAR